HSANVELICPERWRNGTNVTLTCHVDALMVNGKTCPGQYLDVVDFQFKEQHSPSPSPECQVAEYLTQCQSELNESRSCSCNGVSGGRYIFQYTFTVTRERYEGGSWVCSPTCRDTSLEDPLTYSVSNHCVNISFEDFEPTNEAQTCAVIDCSSEHCSRTGCIGIGILVGSVVLIVIIALAVVWFATSYYYQNTPAQPPSQSHNHNSSTPQPSEVQCDLVATSTRSEYYYLTPTGQREELREERPPLRQDQMDQSPSLSSLDTISQQDGESASSGNNTELAERQTTHSDDPSHPRTENYRDAFSTGSYYQVTPQGRLLE
ncbi:hypothetical protein BaRGS_00039725, partial [Batillaria attramentaria]